MGIFDLFKIKAKEKKLSPEEALFREASTIPESERKYYQQDSYYSARLYEGTPLAKEVVTFEQIKATTIPSEHGLYVPEILLLHFCNKHPHPKTGYPGYWWYEYGIRNVGAVLESLMARDFLFIDEKTGKYQLTALGQDELKANEYVPYMHSHKIYTSFTVWDLNKLFGTGDNSSYKDIIDKKHEEISAQNNERYCASMEELKKTNPAQYQTLKSQDDQIKAINAASQKYASDQDLEWIIRFWEGIWKDGGPKFEGISWMFTLPDLYIKARRYDEAIAIIDKIKMTRGDAYQDKADQYLTKINVRKSKENKN